VLECHRGPTGFLVGQVSGSSWPWRQPCWHLESRKLGARQPYQRRWLDLLVRVPSDALLLLPPSDGVWRGRCYAVREAVVAR
jgi:hypothetical protein